MTRRWIVWTLTAFLIALLLLFPLRIAIDMALGRDALLSARQVGGTVWSGRIGNAMLGEERLGTFDVALAPLPLVIGRTEVHVVRLEDPDGPLEGRFFLSGLSEGGASLNGRVNVSGLVAPLPIDALHFENVDALFDGTACKRGTGTIAAIPAVAVRYFSGEISGPVSCGEDGRIHALLEGPRGGQRVDLAVDALGNVEANLVIEGASPVIGDLLRSAGFAPDGDRYTLTSRGRLR